MPWSLYWFIRWIAGVAHEGNNNMLIWMPGEPVSYPVPSVSILPIAYAESFLSVASDLGYSKSIPS